jgi:hypothetical protein
VCWRTMCYSSVSAVISFRNNGLCPHILMPNSVTTTITTTLVETVTHTAIELASVQVSVGQTSTVLSTVVTTVSNVDTATEFTYTTTTAMSKRDLPSKSPGLPPYLHNNPAPCAFIYCIPWLIGRLMGRTPAEDESAPTSPFAPRFDPVPWTDELQPRAGIKEVVTSTTTSIVTLTRTTDITATVSSTITSFTTSIALATSVQTITR